MPLETMRSAALRMSASVTLPANQFQEFHPMGGVAASCCAANESGEKTRAATRAQRRRRILSDGPPVSVRGIHETCWLGDCQSRGGLNYRGGGGSLPAPGTM